MMLEKTRDDTVLLVARLPGFNADMCFCFAPGTQPTQSLRALPPAVASGVKHGQGPGVTRQKSPLPT
jgi:hypothetical protein